MKTLTPLLGLSVLLAQVCADAQIVNINAKDAIPDRYIVVYKDKVNLGDRQKHEDVVNTRAKGKKMRGIERVFQITGFNGYTIEIGPQDLPLIIKNDMVCSIYLRCHIFPVQNYLIMLILNDIT
jgi:hypothetical protein